MKNKNAAITSVGFVILLIFLLILCMITPDNLVSQNENRKLQQLPHLDISGVLKGSYMNEFEVYASDNIVARDSWVRLKNLSDLTLGKKDNGSVYFGDDGYLFPIDKIDKKQLNKNLEYIKTFVEDINYERENSIKVSVLIAPTSTEIIQEKLPKYAMIPNEFYIFEKAEEKLGKMIINPSQALIDHKSEYIYYKTDHHWTTLGAYYAYRFWAEQNDLKALNQEDFTLKIVSNGFYGTTYSKAGGIKVKPDYIQKFSYDKLEHIGMKIENLNKTRTLDSLYDEKYLKTKDKYSYFLSGNNALTTIKGSEKNGRNLLVVKDSYANCFVPFITGNFENIYVIDLRYYKQSSLDLIKEKNISDILFLYNAIQLSNDRNLAFLAVGR